MKYCIGIDIGGTKCSVVLGKIPFSSPETSLIKKIAFETEPFSPNVSLDLMYRYIDNLFHTVPDLSSDTLSGIGISCGGPLDSKNGVILNPPNLPGWVRVPIVRLLKERYHCNVVMQNDANACAVAEWKFGAGKGYHNIVFLTFGTGMGAGLILNGKLYCGANDMAGEIGHISLCDYGPVGYGKAGSFEGFCSGNGIAQLARIRLTEALQTNRLPGWCPKREMLPNISAKDVADAAEAGDPLAISIYQESGNALGKGLAILVDILNPELIILGSIYQRSENLLFPNTEKMLRHMALPCSVSACRVCPCALKDSLGDFAALSLVAE